MVGPAVHDKLGRKKEFDTEQHVLWKPGSILMLVSPNNTTIQHKAATHNEFYL
jgi:hypothetical protein